MPKIRILPKYVSVFLDRHDTPRFLFRRVGFKTTYLRGPVGSAQFADDYMAANATPLVLAAGRVVPRSVSDLLVQFYASNAFKGGSATRQARVRGILEPFRDNYGDLLVASFEFSDIEAVLQKAAVKRTCPKSGRPVGGTGAAEALKKQLVRVFAFAGPDRLKWIVGNPAKAADKVQHDVKGRYTWTEDDIAQYRAHHAIGTTARAALEIMLWTAQRKGDASTFGPAHLKGGKIRIEPDKNAKREQVLWLPAAPALLAAIEALPVKGTRTFLVTSFGQPFTKEGFGNKVREWCDAAGLPQCSSHGLRKAAAVRCANTGATHAELKAVGGWANSAEVDTYIAAANQAHNAEVAMGRVIEWEAAQAG